MAPRISSACSGGDCVEVELQPNGMVKLTTSTWGPLFALYITAEEWDSFIAGAKAGEFDRVALR